MALGHVCSGLWLSRTSSVPPLFHFACTALENTDYREILMCMPDDENVVGWLAALQRCSYYYFTFVHGTYYGIMV
ncbi:hypothetical protein ACSBR1_005598 [Camellia fascicularis]